MKYEEALHDLIEHTVDWAWVPETEHEKLLFRCLTKDEVKEMADSAWENHRAGDPIRDEIHHPIYCRECRVINRMHEKNPALDLNARWEKKWSNRWANDTQDLY